MSDPSARLDRSLEKIRLLWKGTETGKASTGVSIPNEVEFYWSSMLFSIHMRLVAIEAKAKSSQDNSVSETITEEKSRIEEELQLCSELFHVLLRRQ